MSIHKTGFRAARARLSPSQPLIGMAGAAAAEAEPLPDATAYVLIGVRPGPRGPEVHFTPQGEDRATSDLVIAWMRQMIASHDGPLKSHTVRVRS